MPSLKDSILSIVFTACVYGVIGSLYGAMITGNLPMQKVTEPKSNCFKVITGKTTSFETPSLVLKARMERKGCLIGECDEG